MDNTYELGGTYSASDTKVDGIDRNEKRSGGSFWKISFLTVLFVGVGTVAVTKYNELSYDIRILQNDLRNSEREIEALSDVTEKQDQLIASLALEKSELNSALNILESNLARENAELRDDIKLVEAKFPQLAQDITQNSRELESEKTRIQQLSSQYSSLNEYLSNVVSTNATIASTMQSISGDVDEIERILGPVKQFVEYTPGSIIIETKSTH